jgi:hypothetical protein
MLVNLLKNVTQDSKVYEDGKSMLAIAIQEYDQAVLDFTASLMASKRIPPVVQSRANIKILLLSKSQCESKKKTKNCGVG